MQNGQTAGTSSDIVQISSIDSLSTENEDICTLNEIAHYKEPHNTTPNDILLCNKNNDVSSVNKIIYDKNDCDCDSDCDECNEDMSCDMIKVIMIMSFVKIILICLTVQT